MNILLKYSRLSIEIFFLLLLVDRLFSLFLHIELRLPQLFFVCNAFVGGVLLLNNAKSNFDKLIVVYIVFLLLNALFLSNARGNQYLYRSLICQVSFVLFYFIGRFADIDISKSLSNMKWPLVVCMLVGIYAFFTNPGWYQAMKSSSLDSNNYIHVLEKMRLSAFWPSPYELGYACCIYGMYLFYRLFNNNFENKEKTLTYCLLTLIAIVLLLAQMRVCIFMFGLSFMYYFLSTKNMPMIKKQFVLLIVLMMMIGSLVYVQNFLSGDNIEYIITHMTMLSDDSYLAERFEDTSGYGLHLHPSFFGDGIGVYGYEAVTNGEPNIIDNGYFELYAEMGYLGVFLFGLLSLITIFKLLKSNQKDFDICIIVFFLIAMIGASVLQNHHQYGFLFWLLLGYFWKKTYVKKYEYTE